MFMEMLKNRNQKLINIAFQLHQEGCVMADSYIIDVDVFLENAKKILEEVKKYGIKLYYMTKTDRKKSLSWEKTSGNGIFRSCSS